jgi:predicted transposase YbfD/YdcC
MLPDPRPYFAELSDPRRETKNKLHALPDILMIVFCAVLSGIEDWVGMAEFAREKEAWFRQFLELPNGIPSHDTLSDVMGRLAPGVFAQAFLRWAQTALPSLAGEQICLDGKTLRGSRGKEGAVHLLSAYAAKARLVLASQAVDGNSNEITAIPDVLALLNLQGAVVSIDAMGCQKAIAEKIHQAGGDYVLALKDNHPQLNEDVGLWLDTEGQKGTLAVHETVDKGHGRIETRRYVLSDRLDWLEQKSQWPGLQAVGRVESTRIIGEQTTTDYRYYLSSVTNLERFADAVRGHWAIENCQHWVLDVQFGEDAHRARKDHSPTNLAVVRRMALNVIRHNGTSKHSLRIRKLRASLNDDYRFELIFGKPA